MKIDYAEYGITYRQFLDNWARQRWIRSSGDGGSGNDRDFTQNEFRIFVMMSRLIRIGFKPSYAAEIARSAIANGRNGYLSITGGSLEVSGVLTARARAMPPVSTSG